MSTFSADAVRGFSIDELRVNCSKLPAPIQAQWKVNGKKTGLTAEQCRFVLNRQHAEKTVLQSPAHVQKAVERRSKLAHAFWMNWPGDDGRIYEIDDVGHIPALSILGLHSAAITGKLQIQLWTYHARFDCELPAHLAVRDARTLLAEDVFLAMTRGHTVGSKTKHCWVPANISDIIRHLGCLHDGSGGWVVDCDTSWLADADERGTPRELITATGHIFATQGAMNRRHSDHAFWLTCYCSAPGLREYPIPPFYYPEGSEILVEFVGILRAFCLGPKPPPADYNGLLHQLGQLIMRKGYGVDFVPPQRFTAMHNFLPVECWFDDAPLGCLPATYHGYPRPCVEDILTDAIAINHSWATKRPGKVAILPIDRPGNGRVRVSQNSVLRQVAMATGVDEHIINQVMVVQRADTAHARLRRVRAKQPLASLVVCFSRVPLQDAKGVVTYLDTPTCQAFVVCNKACSATEPVMTEWLKWKVRMQALLWKKSTGQALRRIGLSTAQQLEIVAKCYRILEGYSTPVSLLDPIAAVFALILCALPLTSLSEDIAESAKFALRKQFHAHRTLEICHEGFERILAESS